STGLVKVLDFGLARMANSTPLGPTADYLTAVGQIMGTVGYMSPEQARGDIPDRRGDIFSLGCVLYEMATGRQAFPGDNAAEVMAAVLRDDPTDLKSSPHPPSELKQVLKLCLAKRPDQRFQSAGDLAMSLKKLIASETKESFADDSAFPTRPCVAVLPLQN